MDDYVTAFRNLHQFSLLPAQGGAHDQPQFFQLVCDIMNTVRGYIDERNQEKAEKAKELKGRLQLGTRN